MVFDPTNSERVSAILNSGHNFRARVRAEVSNLVRLYPPHCDETTLSQIDDAETLDAETLNRLLGLVLANQSSVKAVEAEWRKLQVSPQAAHLYLQHLRNLSSSFLLRLSERMDSDGL